MEQYRIHQEKGMEIGLYSISQAIASLHSNGLDLCIRSRGESSAVICNPGTYVI